MHSVTQRDLLPKLRFAKDNKAQTRNTCHKNNYKELKGNH